jgi:antirestriction protein ArdC
MNTYEIVTERIVSLLEQGVIPWRRPWSAAGAPCNLISKKNYRGVNFFLLSATKYVSPYWLRLKQANDVGGSVRKGEHGEIVVFWRVDEAENADVESAEQENDDRSCRRLVLRFYRVWNLEQCSLPQPVIDKLPNVERYQHDPIEAAERIMANMPNPPEIEFAGSKAFHNPVADRITLPPRERFTSAEEFYATWNHEASQCGWPPEATQSRIDH